MTYIDLNINERINVKSHLSSSLFPIRQALKVTEWFLLNHRCKPNKVYSRGNWFDEQYKSGRTMSDYQ